MEDNETLHRGASSASGTPEVFDSRSFLRAFLQSYDEEPADAFRQDLLEAVGDRSVHASTLDSLVESLFQLRFNTTWRSPCPEHCGRCHNMYSLNRPQGCVVEHEWSERREWCIDYGRSQWVYGCELGCGALMTADGNNNQFRGEPACFVGFHFPSQVFGRFGRSSVAAECHEKGCPLEMDNEEDMEDGEILVTFE